MATWSVECYCIHRMTQECPFYAAVLRVCITDSTDEPGEEQAHFRDRRAAGDEVVSWEGEEPQKESQWREEENRDT